MQTESKSVVQLKAALREKEMQRLLLMSQLGLNLYKEDAIKQQYAQKYDKLFEKLSANAIEMAQIEADIDLATKPKEEEKPAPPFPAYQPPVPEIKENTVPCPNCGENMRETDAFCFSCGHNLKEEKDDKPSDKPIDIEETLQLEEPVIPTYVPQVQPTKPAPIEEPIEPSEPEEEAIEETAPPSVGFVAVRTGEIVSEGAQLIEKAKQERQRRMQEKKEQEEREKKEREAAAAAQTKTAERPSSEGRLRINPDKVKKEKEAEEKRKQAQSKKQKRKKKAARKDSEAKTEEVIQSTENVVDEEPVPSEPTPEKAPDMPTLRFDEDEGDEFDPWEEYGNEEDELIDEIPSEESDTSDENAEEENQIADVFNDMAEKKKKQRGTWEESLATLETEIDPFAGLERKRKRSFKQDLEEMSEKTPSKTKQTVKINDISQEEQD